MFSTYWRILDANLNRCNEGLRVLEDWCRFVADEANFSQRLKNARHQLQEISSDWPLESLLDSRDAAGDVGREITTESEHCRSDDVAILQANFNRVLQSLRVLEETAKRLSLASRSIEALRYQMYDLQRDVLLPRLTVTPLRSTPAIPRTTETSPGEWRRQNLQTSQLYVLTDLRENREAFLKHISDLTHGGVDIVQLRDKSADDSTLLSAAREAAVICRQQKVLFIINDRPDITVAVGADGVHVGQDELPVSVVRQLIGPDYLIGLSTHDPQQVQDACHSDCDYLGVGPVFPSGTKQFGEFVGPELLQQVAPHMEKPAFAIGGIDDANLHQVLAAGFQRVAVQGAVGRGPEVEARTRALKSRLGTG